MDLLHSDYMGRKSIGKEKVFHSWFTSTCYGLKNISESCMGVSLFNYLCIYSCFTWFNCIFYSKLRMILTHIAHYPSVFSIGCTLHSLLLLLYVKPHAFLGSLLLCGCFQMLHNPVLLKKQEHQEKKQNNGWIRGKSGSRWQ